MSRSFCKYSHHKNLQMEARTTPKPLTDQSHQTIPLICRCSSGILAKETLSRTNAVAKAKLELGDQALRDMGKTLFLLTVALIVGASYAGHTISQTSNVGVSQNTPTPESGQSPSLDGGSEISKKSEKKSVPVEFSGIDFKNLAYPINSKPGRVRLKDGRVEFFEDKDPGNSWFEFKDVDYVDLTGDEKREAVVRLVWVACGGSCDGGSFLFYFYSIENGRLKPLSRIEMGSLAYECGLKLFVLSKRTLTLEAFRQCSFDGVSLRSAYDADERGGKFIAKEFTRFTLTFDKRRFVSKKREVIPNPEIDVKNYPVKITISNE